MRDRFRGALPSADRTPTPLASSCRVERGLYVLRYVEAAMSPPPSAEITMLSGDIRAVPAPGRADDALDEPGQALVIVAETAGEFEIRVTAPRGDGTDSRFSVDRLDAGEGRSDGAGKGEMPRRGEDRRRAAFDHPRHGAGRRGGAIVRAHVSRRGDVQVGAEEWVAGPDEVLPIEGLSIDTGRPDLGVRIRTQSTHSRQRWSAWHDAGAFAGTRQRAESLTAIALALTGDAADRCEIAAEVMALGMPLAAKRGALVEFFGVDPIVGFRFSIEDAADRSVSRSGPSEAPLRVFRAKR